MRNPKFEEAEMLILNLVDAEKEKNVEEILSLYDEHRISDIDWDDRDIITESLCEDLDEILEKCDDLIYS